VPGWRLRRADLALGWLALGLVMVLLTLVHASVRSTQRSDAVATQVDRVASLQLTDLCLFTEARYTRHPTQADLHTPFQDHPQALEHFPSGSLLGPPPTLIGLHGYLDRETALSH
jgi:hypothetical protein